MKAASDGMAAWLGRIDPAHHPTATRLAPPNTRATGRPGAPRNVNQKAAKQQTDQVAVGSQPSTTEAIGAAPISTIPPHGYRRPMTKPAAAKATATYPPKGSPSL